MNGMENAVRLSTYAFLTIKKAFYMAQKELYFHGFIFITCAIEITDNLEILHLMSYQWYVNQIKNNSHCRSKIQILGIKHFILCVCHKCWTSEWLLCREGKLSQNGCPFSPSALVIDKLTAFFQPTLQLAMWLNEWNTQLYLSMSHFHRWDILVSRHCQFCHTL